MSPCNSITVIQMLAGDAHTTPTPTIKPGQHHPSNASSIQTNEMKDLLERQVCWKIQVKLLSTSARGATVFDGLWPVCLIRQLLQIDDMVSSLQDSLGRT